VAGGWRTLHNEVLHNLYNSQNTIKVMKSWRMGKHRGYKKWIQSFGWKTWRNERM